MLVDTHCHLDFNTFDTDREEVIERAQHAGVHFVINPGIDIDTSRAALRLSERHHHVYAAIGIHPNDCSAWDDQTVEQLRELASHPGVVAIGEIGLDYYRERVDHDTQKKVLREQLALAASMSLPVIVHSRKSIDDLFEILSEWCNQLRSSQSALVEYPGVLHAFEGNNATAEKFISLNFMVGIGGPVTFKNAHERQALAADLPIDRILLETDAPFLAPQPYRGQRNEPANIRLIAEKIAELRVESFVDLSDATTQNAAHLFSREFHIV